MAEGIMGKGAILSKSVAADNNPILFAERSDALDEFDSGWQFWGDENEALDSEDAQIWAISEVIDLEPTLSDYIEMPVGTRLARVSNSIKWCAVG